jgi:hypothetical protein
MKTGRGYTPADSIYPLEGLNTLDPSTQARPNFSPNCENVVIDKGILLKRKGYQALGSTADPTVALIEFEDISGIKHLLRITTTKQYKYDAVADSWTNITYQVAAADVDWTGDEEDVIDWAVVSGVATTFQKWVIITNGKDQPRYWDGQDLFKLYAPTYPNFQTCKTIALFYDRIVMGNILTTSQERILVAWSSPGDLIDFVSDGTGASLIPGSRGEILKLMPLGDRLFIYSNNSIAKMTYVGGFILFSFEQVLEETRLVSARSIVNIGPYHLYMSQENIVLFDGTRLTREIGDRIHRKYREELYVEHRYKAWAFNDAAKRHVYFNVPISSSQSRLYQLDYNTFDMAQCKWVPQKLTDRPLSMGTFSREYTLTWDSAAIAGLTWVSADMTWDQASIRKGFPTRVVGTSSRVFLADDTTQSDAGSVISSYWDSIDFTVPQAFQSQLGRWIEIELEMQGVEIDVYFSLDEGGSYEFVESLYLTSRWKKFNVFVDPMSETFRIRLVNNCLNSSFQLRWLRVWFQPGGPT